MPLFSESLKNVSVTFKDYQTMEEENVLGFFVVVTLQHLIIRFKTLKISNS